MIKLLIADDETLEREAIKFIVNTNFPDSFKICEAENGRETISEAKQFQPDILFLDIKMPGCNGIDAAREIRQIVPECHIIILSAYHYFNYAQSAISFGADEYLTKPASPQKIVETLTRTIKLIDEMHLKKIRDAETAQRLEQVSKYLKDEFLIRLALGEMDVQTIRAYFDILQLDFKVLLFAILRISEPKTASSQSEIDRTILQNDLLGFIKNELHNISQKALIRPIGTDFFILLLIDRELDDFQSRVFGINLFNEIKENISYKFGLTVNIGISDVISDIKDIYNACLQAKHSLMYDKTPGATTSFGDISKIQTRSTYPLYKEDQIYDHVIQGNSEKALALLNELLDWIEKYDSEISQFKEKTFELLLVLSHKIMINADRDESNFDIESLRRTIFTLGSCSEIRTYAENFVTSKISEVHRIKKSRASALMTIVTDYLEKNYSKEILLDDVAASIQISSFYLSKLFKRELGKNFIDYLTEVRIRKAKEILANPVHTVKDTCYLVGYRDPNYFTRVFKKICGMTPTEYQAKFTNYS